MQILGFSLLSALIPLGVVFAQEIRPPKNPLQGQIVFEEKGCIECHSIGGYGGSAGPDLSKKHYFGSVLELASVVWNHSPQMNRKFRQQRMSRPTLTEEEMKELFGFLYYLRYLGEPGRVAKGKKLLETKGCISCHRVAGKGGTIGPDFEQVQSYATPLYMVQAMWNHGPAMQEEIKKSKLPFPILTGQDIVDIAAYLSQTMISTTRIRMSPGDPSNGKKVFEAKSCDKCHLVEGKGRIIGPNLSSIELKKGVTEIASLMWNHGQVMIGAMKKQSIDWPSFKENDMADLIAYLYFLGFEDKPGTQEKGARVFQEKGCRNCHLSDGKGKGPDLVTIPTIDSPIRMIQLMWNHAGEMEDLLIMQNKRWPQLSTDEMRDLYAYLRKVGKKL
ncbi:MAG: c-type cytochrome [Bacteroidota bacterium]